MTLNDDTWGDGIVVLDPDDDFDPDVPITLYDENSVELLPEEAVEFRTGKKTIKAAAQTMNVHHPHRKPFEHEVRAAVDFETMQATWEDAVDDIVDAWGDVREQQIASLVKQIEKAVKAGDAEALAMIQAPALGVEVLEEYMLAMADEAINAAKLEAAAQGVTITNVSAADVAPIISDRAQAIAQLMARGISESAARQALLRYGVDNLTAKEVGQAVREHLEGLSDQYLDDNLGGALTQAQNTGRRAVMERGPQKRVYASELLDQNTCVRCAAIDGKEYASLTDAERDYPTGGHKDCLGGARCRGTLVAVYGEAEASQPG